MTSPAELNATEPLVSVSAIVPFVDECQSLQVLLDVLLSQPASAIAEILVVRGERTGPEVEAELQRLVARHADRVRLLAQDIPGLGGALREGFRHARGSHFLAIYADLESDPALVPELVAAARRNPMAVVSASRWLPGGRFEGYGWRKLILNLAFQKLMAALFLCRTTDFTFGYRLYPRHLARDVEWQETWHPFVLESILVPLILGVPVIEVPTVWRSRREGSSSWSALGYWRYLITAARIRVRGPGGICWAQHSGHGARAPADLR
jgi:dolichol-phosphate mannosyltransferase